MGRNHPDFYTALRQLQLEQADTETIIAELSAGRKVKALPRRTWVLAQERLQGLAAEYDDYKDSDEVVEYIHAISYNINV